MLEWVAMMRYPWASKAVVMADPMPPRAPVIKAIFFMVALPAIWLE
jgi:hypothetical protein